MRILRVQYGTGRSDNNTRRK